MKNTILYYYNLNRINMFIKNNETYFTDDKNIYLFELVKDHNEILQVYNLIGNNNIFDKILININNTIFTPYNDKEYILIKLTKNKKFFLLPYINNYNSKLLLRNNWLDIWSIKIDYIEYQYNHIIGKYPIIDESLDYYIGLTENAILYYNYAMKINEDIPLSLCRKRIIENRIYNPTNIIIDYRSRDIAECIKYMYFIKNINEESIINKINSLKLSTKEYYLFFSRLLFPSYYFDIYERIVNDKENINDLKKIIKKRKGYEIILRQINKSIKALKKVEWLD